MLVWFIRAVHYFIVAFFLIAPFTNNQQLLSIHVMSVPFVMAHWITNQSTCALTELEKFLTNKIEDEETFLGKIFSPVYKFQTPGQENAVVWIVLSLLWLLSFYKIRKDNYSHFRNTFTHLRETLRR